MNVAQGTQTSFHVLTPRVVKKKKKKKKKTFLLKSPLLLHQVDLPFIEFLA